QQGVQRAVERAGLELNLVVCHRCHFLEDGVAVLLLLRQREQDVELDAADRHIGAPSLYARRIYVNGGLDGDDARNVESTRVGLRLGGGLGAGGSGVAGTGESTLT